MLLTLSTCREKGGNHRSSIGTMEQILPLALCSSCSKLLRLAVNQQCTAVDVVERCRVQEGPERLLLLNTQTARPSLTFNLTHKY